MKTALFPGTFDPITLGHTDIIYRALKVFDKIYVGIGYNVQKKTFFTPQQRKAWIDKVFADCPRVEAVIYEGLTVDFCAHIKADCLIRGIRYVQDFEFEKHIADSNYLLNPEIVTVIFTCRPEYHFITSSIVRDVLLHRGDFSKFIPLCLVKEIQQARLKLNF